MARQAGQYPVQTETIDDPAQGQDSPRLDASPPPGPPADAPLGLRSRRDLMVENLALRQQLATLAGRRDPVIRPADRLFWILLRRLWSGWAESLAIVRPDTVVRWHRAGFRIYWNWLSRRGARFGRPPLPQEVRALIRGMATENPWGAPRIHGELLRLGFNLSERSVSRYLRSLPRAPRAGQTWTTFLRNHRQAFGAQGMVGASSHRKRGAARSRPVTIPPVGGPDAAGMIAMAAASSKRS
jgi:hypothetical protein